VGTLNASGERDPYIKCAECGARHHHGEWGSGSPRYGCSRAWRNGPSACSNRLTGRIKVIEPKLQAKLRDGLLKPDTLALIVAAVKAAMGDAADGQPERQAELQKQLADERRKRKTLIAAIEGGPTCPRW
jgi:hypothetical protein